MSSPIIVLLLLTILPLCISWITGYFRFSQLGVVDNKLPREQIQQLTGIGARSVAAQKNAWEALVIYSATLLALYITQVPVEQYAMICWAIFALRCLYTVFYLINWDILRSLAFIGSCGLCFYCFGLALS